MSPGPNGHGSIRDAREDDLPRLIELLDQLSLEGSREDAGQLERYRAVFREIAADPHQRLLVLEAEGRVVGSLTLVIMPNLTRQGQPWAQVENVIVDDAARGGGYGEQLMRYCIDAARDAGCYKLALTSSKRRTDAHRFYRRIGFEATHEGFRIEL